MIKLNAGFSCKVGEPNYGSRGASVNVELEGNLIGDPEALMDRIRKLFDLARRSVDAELNGGVPQPESNGGREDPTAGGPTPATPIARCATQPLHSGAGDTAGR